MLALSKWFPSPKCYGKIRTYEHFAHPGQPRRGGCRCSPAAVRWPCSGRARCYESTIHLPVMDTLEQWFSTVYSWKNIQPFWRKPTDHLGKCHHNCLPLQSRAKTLCAHCLPSLPFQAVWLFVRVRAHGHVWWPQTVSQITSRCHMAHRWLQDHEKIKVGCGIEKMTYVHIYT